MARCLYICAGGFLISFIAFTVALTIIAIQAGFGRKDLVPFAFFTVPYSACLAIIAVSLAFPKRSLAIPLAFPLGGLAGWTFTLAVALLFGPRFGAFSFPPLYCWVAAGVATFLFASLAPRVSLHSTPAHKPGNASRMPSYLVTLQDRLSARHAVYAVTAVLVVATIYSGQAIVRKRMRRTKTASQFQAIALALHNYHDSFGYLPKTVVKGTHGEDIWSWRYELTPFLFRREEYDTAKRDEPWNSPANRADWFWQGGYYCYPDQGDTTFILAVTGPGTAFGERTDPPYSFDALDSDTILLIETRASGIVWPQPVDTDIATLATHHRNRSPRGLSSIHENGFHIAFADGAVWFLRDDVPFDRLSRFLTVDGAWDADRDRELGKYRLHSLRPLN